MKEYGVMHYQSPSCNNAGSYMTRFAPNGYQDLLPIWLSLSNPRALPGISGALALDNYDNIGSFGPPGPGASRLPEERAILAGEPYVPTAADGRAGGDGPRPATGGCRLPRAYPPGGRRVPVRPQPR